MGTALRCNTFPIYHALLDRLGGGKEIYGHEQMRFPYTIIFIFRAIFIKILNSRFLIPVKQTNYFIGMRYLA
ncbi:hypothetical protein BN3659_00516 [Alistipes sp. CHKCI003]|nr:hypothetical protein BN3659_00516 [Alistipes sp. CHKCI003]